MLQDLMHRSYNIDKRLAPAFTYTPVYKDPKNSFKLQLSWGPFNGAIPKLKRTKKVSFQKLFLMKYILSHLKPCFSQMSMRMMVGSQGSPTVHSYPALLIQGIQNTCQESIVIKTWNLQRFPSGLCQKLEKLNLEPCCCQAAFWDAPYWAEFVVGG